MTANDARLAAGQRTPLRRRSGSARDFPILQPQVHGKPLVYLDNAATTQKPQAVIDALAHYYTDDNANVHRGVHQLSERATDAYEGGARDRSARFLNAASVAGDRLHARHHRGINLVAPRLRPADARRRATRSLISAMEHHSNIVPWQMLCEERGARLRVVPIDDAAS